MSALETELLRYCREGHLAFAKNVPVSSVVFDERAIYKCKYGCRNFDRKHSCPPEATHARKMIGQARYKWVLLFATTSEIPRCYSLYRRRLENYIRENEIQRISLDFDAIFNQHGRAHRTLSGGSCHRCRICARMKGHACIRPSRMQTSMEAIGIDCQKTMHRAGFDFQMPNTDSINRCGCVFHSTESLKGLHFFKTKSIQRYVRPTLAETMIHCRDLVSSNPDLFESVRIVPTTRLPVGGKECHKCTHKGRNYACPPYASPIEINLWTHAVIWKWSGNDRDKDGYNRAFLEFHKKVFSLGHYLSLGLRDGPCDECTRCALNVGKNTECPHRRLMAPSMQSQGIDKSRFGSGRYGIELI